MAELINELILRCRRGEEAAVALLVARFQPWALDFAAALLGDDHLAEDAVQNAFVTALARLNDLREPRAFAGWFRQILRTEATRLSRARRRTGDPSAADGATPPSQSPDQIAEAREAAAQVREALKRLPPRGRETAQLFYLDDLEGPEVAERLAIPLGTVKRRLHDARQQLRAMLLGDVTPPPARRPKPPPNQIPL